MRASRIIQLVLPILGCLAVAYWLADTANFILSQREGSNSVVFSTVWLGVGFAAMLSPLYWRKA